MFYGTNIKEIDLSNFNTEHVTTMRSMFKDCINLINITFGNMDTSNVVDMEKLFFNCNKITSIDLSHFDTSSLENARELFSHCESLNILDLSNFNTKNLRNMYDFFAYCYKLIYVNLSSFDTSNVWNMQGIFYRCRNLKYLDLQNFDASSLNNSWYTFASCHSLIYLNLRNFKISNKQNVQIKHYLEDISITTKYCIDDLYTKKYFFGNITVDCSDFCFQKHVEFDLDNNRCICNENYKFEFNNTCLQKCPKNMYHTLNNKYICVDEDLNNYLYDTYSKKIKEKLINGYDKTYIDNGNDDITQAEKLTYTITSTKNQKKHINDNVSTIDLGKCEDKLKDLYNISKNDSLYLLKIDYMVENILNIEYEVYYNFSHNNLKKLDLAFCKGIKIDISIPKDIPSSDIDQYNKSSRFYNDICYSFTTDSGTDKSLKDRQNDYNIYNLSVCEEDCDFIEYNPIIRKAICSCFTKESLPTKSKDIEENNRLLANFKDIRNIGNFKMLSCIKLLFNKNNIFKNSANYLIIVLIALSSISIFVFLFYDYKRIKKFTSRERKMDFYFNKIKNKTNKTTNNAKYKKQFKKENILNNDKNQVNDNNILNKKKKIKYKKKIERNMNLNKKMI